MKRSQKKPGVPNDLPDWMTIRKWPRKHLYLSGRRILPKGITGKEKFTDVIDDAFLAFNASRLREACRLLTEKMLEPDVTVGLSLAGALTPGGVGVSCIIPLIKAGFVDWMVSTGANLYHDIDFATGQMGYVGSPNVDDADLRKNDIVRIYDIFLTYSDGLMATDRELRELCMRPEFQKEMGTAEFHYMLGKFYAEKERKNGFKDTCMLAAAYRTGLPIYTSSPGDSALGMNVAGAELQGSKFRFNPSIDVNETTSFVLNAKRSGGKSAVLLIGGGSPKNFVLQTEPHIQEILKIYETGHDYFLQITDARPDTGGLSGATPHEAVSWGKVNPDRLPDSVVCYLDATVALPVLTYYALAKHKRRPLKKLYFKREELVKKLTIEFFEHNQDAPRPDWVRKHLQKKKKTRRTKKK